MIRLRRTLYAQIAGLFLFLLVAFFALALSFMVREFGSFIEELEQRLNVHVARHLAAELRPHVDADLYDEAAVAAMRDATQFNAALDIYVVDRNGLLLAAYPDPKRIVRERIDPAPLRQFLSDDPMLPIRAGDPASPDGDKVFSAASLILPDGSEGYVYVILRGQPLDMAVSMMQNSYIVRGLAVTLLLVLAAVATVGFLLFARLTRRFRKVTTTVRNYRDGRYAERADVSGEDEIGQLARAINEMAGTIEAQIEALRRTDEDRRLLVANLSHDFRTPLTSLRGYAERLVERWGELSVSDRQECLQAILGNTRQLDHLASQLASLSRLDAGHGSIEAEPFSLQELVQDIAIQFRPAATAAGITLNSEHTATARVSGDIGLVERVITNLLDNAITNTPPGGTVDVIVSASEGGVRLTVADSGTGIPEDEIALVRQRFYRTRRSRERSAAGSGLGLAIADEILALHGSTLDIQARAGGGTAVSFTLASA